MELDQTVAESVFLGTDTKLTTKELAETVRAPQTEIRQSLCRLSKLGYPFTLRANFIGRQSFQPIDAKQLRADPSSGKIGQRVEWRVHVSSTQDEMRRIEQEAESGTVLLAETQDSARGRLGRSWSSPYGGIWMSVLLRPKWSKSHQLLTLAFGAAAAKAISAATGISPFLKWPNDVMIHDCKVAGLLAEASYDGSKLNQVIVGLGVNANVNVTLFRKGLRRTATSLSRELGREIDRNLLTRKILEHMSNAYQKFESGGANELLDEAKQACSTLGRRVRVITTEGSFEGEASNLGDDGQLLVRLRNDRTVTLYSADIVHIR